MFRTKRLTKELATLQKKTAPGITLVSAADFLEWTTDIAVLDDNNALYKDQIFRLRFRFSDKYPIEAPETSFIRSATPARAIPLHPHVYSNGVICLDLLGSSGWSPVQNVESVCIALQSMLTGNNKAERPEGDEEFCRRTGGMDASGLPRGAVRGLRFQYDDPTV